MTMPLLSLPRLKPRLVPLECVSALPLLLMLAGCAVTTVDPPKPTAAPAQFKETGLWQHPSSVQTTTVPDEWWKLFNDPVLDDLEGKLVVGNENLKAAIAQVAQARASLNASRAGMWPTLGAGLSATRSVSPSGSGNSNPNNPNTSNGPNESVSLSANANWEIDLWGRLAQASNASEARLQASVDDLASARLSAQALLAQSYFSLRTFEAQQALYERNLTAYTRSLSLTQARYDAGVAGRTDVLQAQTQLKTAQAQLADAAAQRAQTEHAIAVLLGQAPSVFSIARTGAVPDTPAVPVLLPSNLLQRRPDIAAAERRVAAAYAQIGAAEAAFFPSLTLSANAGYRGTGLSDLVSAPNLFWSIGPALAQTLFDGGAKRAASAQARASADQATATYRQTVLTALQEVEDNLAVADQLHSAAQLQREALALAQTNLTITNHQYREGTVSYLNVVSAQTAALGSELNLLSVRSRELTAINQLLKNIAGRWQ